MSRLTILCLFIFFVLPTRSQTPPIQSGGANSSLIERISVSSIPTEANGASEWSMISRNGRFVVYHSTASNLVPNDTNNVQDVFLYDRLFRTTERVSNGFGGVQGNNRSQFGDLSSDGRYIVFHSEATNFVPKDTNNAWDAFFLDRITGQFERISVSTTGQQANGLSIFPDISGGGRFVSFYSQATNLVPNDTNNVDDIFLRDRLTGTTERISVSTAGVQANAPSIFQDLSVDGRYTVYESEATNLVPNDTNNVWDVFLYDRIGQTTERISVNSTGQQGDGRSSYAIISTNNRYVTFVSYATNFDPDDPTPNGDIYVRDLISETTELISRGLNSQPSNGESHYPVISNDGRFIAYHSEASNLVPGDTNNAADVFLYDRQTESTKIVSLSITGQQGNDTSNLPTISDNGRFLVFHSWASNLIFGDTNGAIDIFLYLDLPFHVYLPTFYP
jgi:hypothetical protein